MSVKDVNGNPHRRVGTNQSGGRTKERSKAAILSMPQNKM